MEVLIQLYREVLVKGCNIMVENISGDVYSLVTYKRNYLYHSTNRRFYRTTRYSEYLFTSTEKIWQPIMENGKPIYLP